MKLNRPKEGSWSLVGVRLSEEKKNHAPLLPFPLLPRIRLVCKGVRGMRWVIFFRLQFRDDMGEKLLF